MGCDPAAIQQAANVAQQAQQQQAARQAPGGGWDGIDDEYREFISVFLNDSKEAWTQLFRDHVRGGSYRKPNLVMFSGQTTTRCGIGQVAMVPFYCPADQQVYIDPRFFEDLARRHRVPGDFAQAYVIAHEVAHHVQNLLGLNQRAHQAHQSGDERMSNRESVRLERQADYLAGVWAHHAHRNFAILEEGDMEEAIRAANQIGDDALQKKAGGYVVPERFTRGTSAQRVRWFRRGLDSGSLDDCELLFEVPYERL